jgi:site-specific recombinase XerD
MPFASSHLKKSVDQISPTDLSADLIRTFLTHLEKSRGCGIATRNQRLAAIHALANFVGLSSPEHISWTGEIRSVPFKKASHTPVPYLEKPDMDGLLGAADRNTAQGRRDHALLLFLYNTGARADEAAQALIGDLDLAVCDRDYSSVSIRGKGNKTRRCPLWA